MTTEVRIMACQSGVMLCRHKRKICEKQICYHGELKSLLPCIPNIIAHENGAQIHAKVGILKGRTKLM